MEEDRLDHFVLTLQDAFLNRRWEEFHRYFAFPLVIYTVIGVKVVRDWAHLQQLMEHYARALQEHNVLSTSSEIVQRDPPKNQRIRLTVRFAGHGPDDTEVTTTVLRYFVLEADGTFKIEMIEYLQEPFPKSVVEQIFH